MRCSYRSGLSEGTGALLVAAVAFLASANALLNGFVWDDIHDVLQNPWIRDPSQIGKAFTHHLAGFEAGYQTSYYRPAMHVVYAICYAAVGFQAWGYHLANVLVHAAVSATVFVLLARWSPQAAPVLGRAAVVTSGDADTADRRAAVGPLTGALLFAVHPIHADAVAWLGGITDLSYTLFVLLALVLITDRAAGPAARFVLAPALFLLATLCKEPSVVLLPIVFVVLFARGDLRRPDLRRGAMLALATLAAVIAAYLALRVNALGGLTGADRRVHLGAWDGAATAVALFGEYVRKLLLPFPLSAIHDFPVVTSAFDVRVFGGAAVVAALAFAGWRLRRNVVGLLGLALLVFPLLPALYTPAMSESLFSDRYLYLPSAGAVLLLSAALEARPAGSRITSRLRIAIAGVAILASAAGTIVRNSVWHDSLSLWSDTAQKIPGSAAAHEYLGYALLTAGQPQAAASSLSRALDLDASRTDARTNLASALVALGSSDEAIMHAQLAVRERPSLAETHAVLGVAMAAQGRLGEAIASLERALTINPSLAAVHNAAGVAYARLGRFDVAVDHFREAVRLEPGNAAFARNLALIPR